MARRVSATEARVHFGELMRRVVESEEPVIVERAGREQMVFLSLPEYERLRNARSDNPGWPELLAETHRGIRRSLGERALPAPEEIIRAVREERDAQLLDLS